jgi:hypothetical protein
MTDDESAKMRAAKRAARESYYVLKNCETRDAIMVELERLFLSGIAWFSMADTIPAKRPSGEYAVSDVPADRVPRKR